MTTKNTKNTASQYLAIAFFGRLIGDSEGLIKKNQRCAARVGAPLTVTHRTDHGAWVTNASAYDRFVASTQPAAPALSLMERVARATEATRPAGCKTLALG
jgi:hypothetical protein